jgi:hypothetical protein
MAKDRIPQRDNSVVYLVIGVLVFFISACASNRRHSPPPVTGSSQPMNASSTSELKSASQPKLILSGKLDCRSREVQITGGVVDPKRLRDLQEVRAVLEEKHYAGTLLDEIESLRVCETTGQRSEVKPEDDQGGVSTADFKPSSVLEIEIKDYFVLFSLSQVNFGGFDSVAAYLKEVKDQEACKAISERCVKCPDKKIYCTDGQK